MTIDDATLETAIREALRFLHAAQALRQARKEYPAASLISPGYGVRVSRMENGACNRASMDLTRALAKLRAGK